ncbi:MAG: 30S ribosomal protein S20 [Acidobacteria bacterium]|nr:MAG: 30S ribosomal protein S20 [Acidobacteriota bacterium]
MANIRSQIKRNRQNEKRRLRNKQVRSELKTRTRRVREAIQSGDSESIEAALRSAGKAYDKAAAKGVIHKNKAANAKSRLAKQVTRETT